jgi:hypothetical protein
MRPVPLDDPALLIADGVDPFHRNQSARKRGLQRSCRGGAPCRRDPRFEGRALLSQISKAAIP